MSIQHILSTQNVTKEFADQILASSEKMEAQCKKGKVKKVLENKIVACIFFEPSTRTRLSFETAALRLGAQVISAEDATSNGSTHKGETIEDTTKIISSYADVMVMRHFEKGSLESASNVAKIPIINAGDGAHEHPSQAYLDLYTIKKEQKTTSNLTIAFVGDLINSRTIHSLVPLLNLYQNNTFYFVSPKELKLPSDFTSMLSERGVVFVETEDLNEALPKADILYMTRVQKERFSDMNEYEKIKDSYILRKDHLNNMKSSATIMHPLPRVNEIEHEIDNDNRAAYFRQAQNGLYVRMALLANVLGK